MTVEERLPVYRSGKSRFVCLHVCHLQSLVYRLLVTLYFPKNASFYHTKLFVNITTNITQRYSRTHVGFDQLFQLLCQNTYVQCDKLI